MTCSPHLITCSNEVISPGVSMDRNVVYMHQHQHQPFSGEHFWSFVSHTCQPILGPFISHKTFRLLSDNDSSKLLLLRHCFVIYNHICLQLVTICQHCNFSLPDVLSSHTRWFKYDRDNLCVNKPQFVLVIFEPPCILL
jgi:hypothetical protein